MGRIGTALLIAVVAVVGAAGLAGADERGSEPSTQRFTRGVVTGGGGFEAPEIPELELLGIRETDDGVTLRLYEQEVSYGGVLTADGSPVPEECIPDRELQVQVSTRRLAMPVGFHARAGSDFSATAELAGYQQHPAVGVVLARLPDGASAARVRFEDGVVDRSGPVDGRWVVLASQLTGADRASEAFGRVRVGKIQYLDDDGDVIARETVLSTAGPFLSSPGCELPGLGPAPLPEATGPPPDDPAAARAAIRKAFHAVYGGTPDEAVANIEDGESVRATMAAATEANSSVESVEAEIEKIKFLDVDEAAVRFGLLVDGNPVSLPNPGRAVLVDGTWKVARSTVCELLALGGAECPV